MNPRAAYVIGVHVEQHLSVAGLATLTGEVIATHAVEVPQRRESAPIDEMTAAVDGVLAAAGLPRDPRCTGWSWPPPASSTRSPGICGTPGTSRAGRPRA